MIRMVLLIGIGLLGGCAKLGAAARVDPPVVARYPNAATSASDCASPSASKDSAVKHGAINLDCFKFPEANGPFVAVKDPQVVVGRLSGGAVSNPTIQDGVISLTITGAKLAPDLPAYDLAVADKRARNRLTAILLNKAGEICEKDQASITANQSALDGFLTVLTTGLASAGSLVTGERANAILAGTAAFVSGSRDNISAAVYRNQLAPAITAASAAERKRLLERIEARRNDSIVDYSVDDMIRSVNEYHQACSFYKGVELALTTATKYPALEAYATRQQALNDIKLLETQLTAAKSQLEGAQNLPNAPGAAATERETAITRAMQNYKYILDQIGRLRTSAFGIPGSTPPAEAPKQ